MSGRIKLDERLTIGSGPPTEGTLLALARDGYKAVVNLRTPDEREQPLDPDEEGEKVRALGMAYRHVPVRGDALSPALFDAFRDAVTQLPGPIFVHCASGRRAGLFAIMQHAVERGLTGAEALAEARRSGLSIDDSPDLAALISTYVDRNRRD